MKKLMKRKNNKGFSLVELIVVVLIMGIIAVALAPQVMKWVGEARESTDDSQAATIKSSIQIAYADWQAAGGELTSGIANVDLTSNMTGVDSGLQTKINEVLGGEYPTKQDNSKFKISITTGGQVTVK